VLIGNDPVIVVAGTITDPGTVKPFRLVLPTLTIAPPDPAACDSVTMQLPLVFDPSVVGLHCSEETAVGTDRVILALCDAPPYDAVMEPLWLALRIPVVIGKDPVVEFAATVTLDGIVSPERPELLRLTTAPPDPAACDSVTVQLPLPFDPNVVGLHCRAEITPGVTAVKDTVAD